MAFNCGVSFGACMVRITRVDENGNVIAGNNAYVTDKPVSINVNPNIETGNAFSVRNGCGCSISRRKFPDTFNWWELSLQTATLEPEMIAFMLGAATIADGADIVGVAFPSALWTARRRTRRWRSSSGRSMSSARASTRPTRTSTGCSPPRVWQIGDNTFEEGPAQPTLNAFSQTNGNWGDGPYGDGPPDGEDISEGGFWATADALPTAECAAQAVTAVS